MPNQNPTIVSASLSDKELQDSINKMVANFDKGLQTMLEHSNEYVGKIQASLQKIGNTNFGATGSNDGAVVKQTKAQNDFSDAVKKSTNEIKRQGKETVMSFDQIAAAQQKAIQTQGDSTLKKSFNRQELQQYIDRLRELQAEYVKVNTQQGGGVKSDKIKADIRNLEELIAKYREILKNLDYVNSRQGTIDVKKWVQDLGAVDDRYKKLVRWYTVLEKEDQRRIASEEKANQKRLADLEKEKAAQDKVIKSYQDSVLKAEFGKVMKMPTSNIDEIRAKFERLSTIIANIRELGILSPEKISAADSEVKKLGASIQRYEKFEQERIAAEQKFIVEQQKEIENLTTIEGRVKSLSQATKQYFAENKGEYWRTFNAYGKDFTIYNPEKSNRANGLSIEEQITNILKEEKAARESVSQAAQQQNGATQNVVKAQKEESEAIRKNFRDYDSLRQAIASVIGIKSENVRLRGVEISSINDLSNRLKELRGVYNQLGTQDRHSERGKELISQIQNIEHQMDRARKELSRPIDLKSALGTSEKTLDDIAYKMRQLASYRSGLNVDTQKKEITQVNDEYNRLKKRMDEVMQKNQQMIASNTALGRSWNYMKNRLAFYFTVGASTSFIKNLIEVRSQYEMNERALGILIDSAERGTRIFNELSQMALVSPYTLIELSTAAKQLTAYDVAAKDVVDTTRRLADMAAAVGIPIERLTYALGQIKAYGYLNSRDARMFANAGIPLVKQLSDYYTELEGRLVSTADVYDRIKKKAIDYNEVMEVINKMTDEGGKFFDFQAKMADTLKVRLANLTLAWNNMLNEIGKSNQGILTFGIGALKELFLQWKKFSSAIYSAAWAGGLVIAIRALNVLLVKAGFNFKILSKDMTAAGIAGQGLATKMRTLGSSIASVAKSSLTWWTLLAFAVVDAAKDLYYMNEAQENLNKSIRDGAKDNYDNISKFIEQYKEVRESLYSTKKVAMGSLYNPETRKAEATLYVGQQVEQDIDKNEAKKAWEAIREQIELTSQSSDVYISKLLTIENMSERVRQGFNVLDYIQVVNAALKEIDDDTIKMSASLSAWWNLWSLPDGLIDNLEDYKNAVNDTENSWKKAGITIASFLNPLALYIGGTNIIENYVKDNEDKLSDFREDLKVTTDSIIDFIELKGWSGDESKINQVFEQITQKLVLDNQLDPQKAFTLQTEVEEARSKAAKKALLQRINDEKEAYKISRDEQLRQSINADVARYNSWNETNGRSKVEWERFTKWLKEQHISETTAMFRNMDAEDIKSLNFQEGKHAEWVTRMVTQYAKEHKMSIDEVEGYLKNFVRNANRMSIFIPLIISTKDKKSVYDQLGEYDKAIDEADAQIERLTKRIGELNEKKEKSKEETEELGRAEQELADAQNAKADAEAKGGHGKKEKKDRKEDEKDAKQAETELQKALKDELSTIDKVRSIYKDLTKEGMSHANAVERATRGWDETVNAINRVLQKNGLQKLNLSKFVGIENPRELVNMLQSQLNILVSRGAKPAEIKELQTKIQTLNVDAEKYDLTKITKGLNNELGKLKDEYELAVELDANPELGDMFADMFGINTSTLPKTFGEALDRAQIIINRKLAEMNITTPFDLKDGNIDSFAKSTGLDKDGAVIKELISAQNAYRDMFKKNITETEKILDDYIKKYGDYSDKIAEIEAGRLEKLKKLNEAYYTEEMRKRPEYVAKLNAIEQGANKEKRQVDFDEFKNSRYYTMMFENLDYISTKTIRDMRDRVRDLIDTMNDLTPEQLKTLMSQYEKLEQKLVKRRPFKTLTKDLKEYFSTSKERKAANQEFKNAQKEYDVQKKSVAALKEKYEQAKANTNTSQSYLDFLQIEIDGENEILQILKQQLDAAQKKADKYNLIKKLALEEAEATAQLIAQNLASLAELRDNLQQTFGFDFGDSINAAIDGLTRAGNGISKTFSSLQSGNVVGATSGVVDIIGGIGDSIASIFGDGSERTKRLNREINESREAVRQLSMAYDDLERAINKSLGTGETEARRLAIANKEAQLAELERQKELEQSKRSKDRDDDAIKQYEEAIHSLRNEIEDLKEDVINNLWGEDVKSAAEAFVDAWVEAWKAGETTIDAIKDKMDEMIYRLVKKAMTGKIVESLLKPLYSEIDRMTKEGSEGGVALTVGELRQLAQEAGFTAEQINTALGEFYGSLGDILPVDTGEKQLSALQQGISQISETTANALEAYMNSVNQQVYYHSSLLEQIRDSVVGLDLDVSLGVQSQMLLQLQSSYQVQMSIQGILEGVLTPSGRAFSVELMS